ncbi:MAG: hypothetical protein F6K62_22670 [Sphaerospermopsis sp. SIO1G2]|nr:hypothetical protein [Sphaerospermopsis sp. SIO1G2]
MQNITQTLVKWFPTGTGIGVTGHFLLNQQWTQAVISTFFTAVSSLWVKFSGKFMETLEKKFEDNLIRYRLPTAAGARQYPTIGFLCEF